jgi:long-chain acyl-CoA synthetase
MLLSDHHTSEFKIMRTAVNPFTLQQAWKDFTVQFAELPALGFVDEEPVSYASLGDRIRSISAYLRGKGIAAGDRVALLSENRPEWAMAYFAINNIGAIIVPILPDFPASDVGNILEHSGSRAIFVSPKLAARIETTPKDCAILDIEELAALPGADEPGDPPLVAEDDTACIIYTSGTTGQSKGVMLSNKNLVWNACASKEIPPVHRKHRLLSILPLSHTYECTLGMILPLISGARVYYIKRPPSSTVLLPALARVRPHLMLSVPLLIEKIYRQSVLPRFSGDNLAGRLYRRPLFRKLLNRAAGAKLKRMFGRRLFFFGIGGAALDPEVERFLREARFPYAIGYGLTETSPLVAGSNYRRSRYRSTGPVVPGLEVRLDNPDDDGVGEILVRGPSVMQGYYRNEEKTSEVLSEDGWFRTGDLGAFERDYLYIKGRLKNLILGPSGENIYPEAIEAVINNVEFVEESLVYQEEQSIVARIKLNYEAITEYFENLAENASHIPQDVGEYLKQVQQQVNRQLSNFARLHRVIEQKDEFEKTPTKKIRRFLYIGRNQSPEDEGGDQNATDQK